MKTKILFGLLILSFGKLVAQNKADDITGVWLTPGDRSAKIQIYKSGEEYYGKIIWMAQPLDQSGKPKTDTNNPDKSKQSVPLMGMILLADFKFNGKDE